MVKMIDGGTVIGGNLVQLDNKNRIHVTNQKGKSKVLTHDQFKRQVLENQDKIYSGQNFDFKKETSPAKKLVMTILGAGALIGGIVYRKKIVDFFKGVKTSETGSKIKQGLGEALDTAKKVLNKPDETATAAAAKTKELINTAAEKSGEAAGKVVGQGIKICNWFKKNIGGFFKQAK